MELNKGALKTELQTLLQTAFDDGKDLEWVAANMADTIEKFVKSGSVSVTVNATVSGSAVTTCSAGPGTGTVSGTATQSITNGTIS